MGAWIETVASTGRLRPHRPEDRTFGDSPEIQQGGSRAHMGVWIAVASVESSRGWVAPTWERGSKPWQRQGTRPASRVAPHGLGDETFIRSCYDPQRTSRRYRHM